MSKPEVRGLGVAAGPNLAIVPSRAPYQPHLTWRSHAWRLGLMLLTSALASVGYLGEQWADRRAIFWLDVVGGVFCYLIVHWRRRRPLLIAVVITAIGSVSLIATGPLTLAMASLATRRRVREMAPAVTLLLVSGQLSYSLQGLPPSVWWQTLVSNAILAVGLIASGMYVGSRRELVWTLRERAETAEREQGMRVAQARLVERERIAREMHDVLAHRISLVAMHSGALAFRSDLADEAVRTSAEVINDNAHRALTDLREVLGMLRGSEDARVTPQPTIGEVKDLIDEAREAGIRVHLETDMSDAPVPESTGRTVYRVVQEVLTNVRKHAPAAASEISLSGAPGEGVTVHASNPLPPGPHDEMPASGLGLVGMAERLTLAGGHLEHELTPDRFELTAWVPWAS